MRIQHPFAGDTPHRLLKVLLYTAIAACALQTAGAVHLGNIVLIAVGVAFAALLLILLERSRRCLD